MPSPFDWLRDIGEAAVDAIRGLFGAEPDEPEEEAVSVPNPAPDFYEVDEQEAEPEDFEQREEDDEDDDWADYDDYTPVGADGEHLRLGDDYIYPNMADPADIRKIRYSSFEDAFNFLAESAIGSFSRIVYFPEDDLWGIAVEYEEP